VTKNVSFSGFYEIIQYLFHNWINPA